MILRRILTLIIKELLSVLRDPKTRLSLLAPPLIQLFIFTHAATLDVQNVPIGILNKDHGEKAFELVQRFHGSRTFNHIIYLSRDEEIAPFMDHQKGVMVLSIDEQFSRNLDGNKEAFVQLILDGRKSNTAQIVMGYTNSIISRFNEDVRVKHTISPADAQIISINWFNHNLIYYWYNIPSLVATLSMITCLVVTSISVARERELGTFDQLLVSPLSPLEILIGKIVPGIIVGVFEGLLMFCIGVFIFKVPFMGSFPLFVMSLLLFITSISGIGLFISSLSTTQQQAMLGTFVFMVPTFLLSGYATPIENMPTWLQPITYIMPLRYMLVISKGIFLKAMPFSMVFQNLWPLIPISMVTLSVSSFSFRRRLE